MKSKLIIKCPRCGKKGRLRLKDKRYNSVMVSHYDSKKYLTAKSGGSKTHYLGTIRTPEKLITKIFLKYGVKYTEEDKEEFSKVVKKFTKLIKTGHNTDISQNEITGIATTLNELRRIRKTLEIEFKIIDRKIYWENVKCHKCHTELGDFWAEFRGVQNKNRIMLHHPIDTKDLKSLTKRQNIELLKIKFQEDILYEKDDEAKEIVIKLIDMVFPPTKLGD